VADDPSRSHAHETDRGRQRTRRTFAALAYYAASLPVLARGIRTRRAALSLLLARPREPVAIGLADGTRLLVRSALELWVAKEVCLDRQYERLGTAVEDGWTVLDVGASIGDFAISVARRRPGCVVHALEPEPASFDLLCANIELNGVANVHAHRVALGDRDGDAGLAVDSARAPLSSIVGAAAGRDATVAVPVRRLDRVLADLAVDRVDFLKIDCEGAEEAILRSVRPETLRQLRAVVVEYHDAGAGTSLETLLRAAGFDVHRAPSPVHRGMGLLHAVRRGPEGGN
jgi:FkbM family methyltransferase